MRFALVLAIAACGGAIAPTNQTATPTSRPSASATSASGNPSATLTSTAPFAMKAPTATALTSELAAIGLDPAKLPPLAKLAPDQLRKVMPLFAKSLGVKCTACHVWNTDGPPPKTPRMNVAEQMWNQFVRRLELADGSPLFCDSCHQGSLQVLDRHDLNALATWMKESFVTKLARTDEKEHGCATCHGNPIRPRFIEGWKHP